MDAGRRPACERRAHSLERRHLRAAAIARQKVLLEVRAFGHIGVAGISIEIGHDRLLAIA
jgi:hypothetical protein